jgi:excisionase family DNA binding protein
VSRNSPVLSRDAANSGHAYPDPQAGSVDSGQLVSTTKAAKRLGISPNTLRKYVAAGLISAVRVGPKLLRFDPVEVHRLARVIDNRSA